MKRTGTADELANVLDFRHGADVARIRLAAAAKPWDGRQEVPQSQRLIVKSLIDPDLRISMLYSFDIGTHDSGWWANSEYNACKHLSIVGITREACFNYENISDVELRAWARVWFGSDVSKAWNEPPASKYDEYRNAAASSHANHIRVFVDRKGNAIIPEGEVYTLKPFDDGSSPDKIFRR